jgi:hypothetical protein
MGEEIAAILAKPAFAAVVTDLQTFKGANDKCIAMY